MFRSANVVHTTCQFFACLLMVWSFNGRAQTVTTIALVGDSITSGYPQVWCGKAKQAYGGYAPYLESLLDSGGWQSTLYNYGIAGDRAQWAFSVLKEGSCTGETWVHNAQTIEHNQIPVALAREPKPKYMLYLFGTNDLALYSARTVVAYIKNGVNLILRAGVIPIVGTILPDNRSGSDIKDISGANALLRSWLNENDIQIAEFYNAASNSGWNDMMSDGLHPDVIGRQFMAEIWHKALLEHRAAEKAAEEAAELAELARLARLARLASILSASNSLLLLE